MLGVVLSRTSSPKAVEHAESTSKKTRPFEELSQRRAYMTISIATMRRSLA